MHAISSVTSFSGFIMGNLRRHQRRDHPVPTDEDVRRPKVWCLGHPFERRFCRHGLRSKAVVDGENIVISAIELTRALLAFDTCNPPGLEAESGRYLAHLLEMNGFVVETQDFAPHRLNIIARLDGSDADAAPLVLTGHLDTVPLGAAPWSRDPFNGELSDGRLYGRGVSDMKAGVAAMACAAIRFARGPRLRRGLVLVFTSGEETGCIGALAFANAARPLVHRASAMLVGEPTANRISTAHKGCVAVKAHTTGITAHSSMPEKGENAIYAAAQAVARIAGHVPAGRVDPLLGCATINVGMITGGLNYNSVPDAAEFTVDVRTVPGMDHDMVHASLADLLGNAVRLERFVDMPPVGTAADHRFVGVLRDIVADVFGSDANLEPLPIPFFSDASVFQPLWRCPTIIIGPGEPSQAHQTDEWCEAEAIPMAVEIYARTIAAWCDHTD
ncbi:M20 family metallopeptidase [Sphingomonas sp. So64.6b]|uniref:M20 family metallopeptidase n=1 Tax=Sphingomonas sp. So64.6b TaxID=2997354 RepID=UPI001602D95B|nr:M20 family metallopeptidase [Sphingomonas sp. So64.6b]QNA85438.1 M20 family metallopeptidase [Sphingomonas sp. So64.6b]